jgi:hypothetical protein
MEFTIMRQNIETQLEKAKLDLLKEGLTYAELNEIQKFIRETTQFLVFEIDTLEENYLYKQSLK